MGAVFLVCLLFLGVDFVRAWRAFDPTKDFTVMLGRGSGWDGLETIKVERSGRVVAYRQRFVEEQKVIGGVAEKVRWSRWDVASFKISQAAVDQVCSSILKNRLMTMEDKYENSLIADGEQRILLIKHGGEVKWVYFNNSFPWRIESFAADLEQAVGLAKLPESSWEPVPQGDARVDEKALWESTKQW